MLIAFYAKGPYISELLVLSKVAESNFIKRFRAVTFKISFGP